MIALPCILVGCITQRLLTRWLHWRLSFLLWFVLLFVGAFILYRTYQHGLQAMMNREIADYIDAGKHHQFDLASYPLHQLWAETWPVWLSTLPGIGIAGFAAEVYSTTHRDTARTLRLQERCRQHRAHRFQLRARKRTSRPEHVPDGVGGLIVIGVPIRDDEEA